MLASSYKSFQYAPGSGAPIVKICGIMQPEQALSAATAGADMIGLVFAHSRRELSVAQAEAIRSALDRLARRPVVVGVFVNETQDRIDDIARRVRLDAVQLSGDETPEEVGACIHFYPVIKALRFVPGTAQEEAISMLARYRAVASDDRLKLLVDTHNPGVYGGTGETSDWALAAKLAAREELIVAGGLNPGNVAEAVVSIAPWGVDVSSGVESGGVKDPTLIRSFIRAAHHENNYLT